LGGLQRVTLEKAGFSQSTVDWSNDAFRLRLLLLVGTSTWYVGLFRLLYQQSGDVDDLLRAIEEATAEEPIRYLQMRAARAPGFIKRQMLGRALSHEDHVVRRRYITVFRRAPVLTFPRLFIARLQEQNKYNKLWVLRETRLTLQENQAGYSDEDRINIWGSVRHQLRQQTHEAAVVTRLWSIGTVLATGAVDKSTRNTVLAELEQVSSTPVGSKRYEQVQKILIEMALRTKLANFPQAFLYHLRKHSPTIIVYGLNQIRSAIENKIIELTETQKRTVERMARQEAARLVRGEAYTACLSLARAVTK
jgi:hypothetical protein